MPYVRRLVVVLQHVRATVLGQDPIALDTAHKTKGWFLPKKNVQFMYKGQFKDKGQQMNIDRQEVTEGNVSQLIGSDLSTQTH